MNVIEMISVLNLPGCGSSVGEKSVLKPAKHLKMKLFLNMVSSLKAIVYFSENIHLTF